MSAGAHPLFPYEHGVLPEAPKHSNLISLFYLSSFMDQLSQFLHYFSNDYSLLNGILAFIGTLLGFPYIYLQYKASPKFWYVSAVNALPFVYVNFVHGNFATATLFAYYFYIAVQAVFFSSDKGKAATGDTFIVRHIPRRLYPRLVLIFAVLFVGIFLFVTHAHDIFAQILPNIEVHHPTTPLADAFATALSFVSMWLLSKKYIEQWIAWVVVNTAYVYMYLAQDSLPWAALFFVYGVVAVLGFFNWTALLHRQQSEHIEA